MGFVLTDGRFRVGYCTDTGKITTLIEHHLRRCHLLVLESNHDPQMLRNGPYPLRLQQRIRSGRGHLANEDAGRLLAKLTGASLSHVILSHLSEANNQPALALQAARQVLEKVGGSISVACAGQDRPGPLVDLAAASGQGAGCRLR